MMRCAWSDQYAYRYAAGAVAGEEREGFAQHLAECPSCRAAVAEAAEIDALLRESIVPLDPPADLVGRIAARAVPDEREAPRRGFAGLLQLPRLRLLSAAAAVLLALTLSAAALVAPEPLLAVMREWLYFVPGIGMTQSTDVTLVARGPVIVRANGLTFEVLALLSDGKVTEVKFRFSGVPGGKAGWGEPPRPATKLGAGPKDDPAPSRPKTSPFLRDADGRTYQLQRSSHGAGGSAEETIITGEAAFAPLPKDLESVDLVMPTEWLVPATVLGEPAELVARIELTHPALGGLTQGYELDDVITVNGITLRARSIAFPAEGAVVEIEALSADGAERVIELGGAIRPVEDAATLVDSGGRTYRLKSDSGGFVPYPYQRSLLFPEAKGERAGLRLRVATIRVMREGSATLGISLAGRRAGEQFPIDAEVSVGDQRVRVLAGELIEEGGAPWLKLYLDLGASTNGRKLVSVSAGSGRDGSFFSSHDERTGQTRYVGVQVGADRGEARVTFSGPVLEVSGPWEVALEMGGGS